MDPFPLYIGGFVLLASFLNIILSTALPFRILDPEWLLRLAGVLLTVGTTALIAVLFLHIAEAEVHHLRDSVIGRRARLVRRLAGWAAIGYLLLIPAQILAGYNLINLRAAEEKRPQVLWDRLRSQIVATATEPELRSLLAQLPDVPPLPSPLQAPLPQVKQQLISSVDRRFADRQTRLDSASRQRLQNVVIESIRNSIQSLLLALGFAALAKQGRKHALSGLLDRLFPFL